MQPSGESSLTSLSLSSFTPTTNSISENISSLTSNNSKSNDQFLVNACTSGGSNEVNRCFLLGEGQGSCASAWGSVTDSPMMSDQRGGSEVPLGATGALPCKQNGTSGSIEKGKPSRAWIALNDIADIPEHSRQVILKLNDPNRKIAKINPFIVKAE